MKKLLLLLLFVGCNPEKIVEPSWDSLSGVYKSVAYDSLATYNLGLEIRQRDNEIYGTIENETESYSIKGIIRDNHLILKFDLGILDMFKDIKGTYYPLAGACIWRGEMRAVRFELISKLHDQGKIQ